MYVINSSNSGNKIVVIVIVHESIILQICSPNDLRGNGEKFPFDCAPTAVRHEKLLAY